MEADVHIHGDSVDLDGGAGPANRTMNIRRRIATVVLSFLVFTMTVLVFTPAVGGTPISLAKVLDQRHRIGNENVDAPIFFVARLPR